MESDSPAIVGFLSKGKFNLSSRWLEKAPTAPASCPLVICGHLHSTYELSRCLREGKPALRFSGAASEFLCNSVHTQWVVSFVMVGRQDTKGEFVSSRVLERPRKVSSVSEVRGRYGSWSCIGFWEAGIEIGVASSRYSPKTPQLRFTQTRIKSLLVHIIKKCTHLESGPYTGYFFIKTKGKMTFEMLMKGTVFWDYLLFDSMLSYILYVNPTTRVRHVAIISPMNRRGKQGSGSRENNLPSQGHACGEYWSQDHMHSPKDCELEPNSPSVLLPKPTTCVDSNALSMGSVNIKGTCRTITLTCLSP